MSVVLLWIPSLAALLGAVWLFGNPREMGVAEARSLAARRPARTAFWFVLGALAVDWGRFAGVAVNGRREWVPIVLPAALAVAYMVFRWKVARTHPGILETASDALVRDWRRRLPSVREAWVVAAVLAVLAAVRYLLV